jgi:tetratricopeptide (TPR) repeat protein
MTPISRNDQHITAEEHVARGRSAMHEMRFTDAIADFRCACKLSPENPALWMRLAEACWRVEKYGEVICAVDRALQIRPESAMAHDILGCAYLELSRSESFEFIKDAEASFRKAIKLKPDFFEAHTRLADTLVAIGEYQEAVESYRRALDLAPSYLHAVTGAAIVFERLGKIDDARAILAHVIEKGIDSISLALAYTAISCNTGEENRAIALLEQLLGDQTNDRNMRMQGHFMLGKIHDANENFDTAFRHYRAANALNPGIFDATASDHAFKTVAIAFDEAMQAGRPRASNHCQIPVFIVGMPRSGTTLVEQILSTHPQIHGAGELLHIGELTKLLPGLTGVPWPECIGHVGCKTLDKLADEHLNWLSGLANGKARVTDKLPHNFRWLGLIDLLFPNARIIHCQRDPLDNCLSIYFQPFTVNHAYASDLQHLGIYYRQYERMMAHWRKTLRVPMFDLHYEAMVAKPEQCARELVEFCELEWDDRCLRFYESGRAVATHSYDQVRQPIYTKSVARWKHYEKYLEPLRQGLGYVEPTDFGR